MGPALCVHVRFCTRASFVCLLCARCLFIKKALLVFWPRAGAVGARAVLSPCAQLLLCELYVMKDLQQKKIPNTLGSVLEPDAGQDGQEMDVDPTC